MIRVIENSNNDILIIKNIDDAKKFISTNLKSISDQAFANVLREIIFQSNIEWKDIQLIIKKYMPEVKIESSIKEAVIDLGDNLSKDDSYDYFTFKYNNQEYSYDVCKDNYKAAACRNKKYIRAIHPYDDSEYYWAVADSTSNDWRIIFRGKIVDNVTNVEDIDEVVDVLEEYNRDIKSTPAIN